MYRACIAILDAAHARLFTYTRSTENESQASEQFSELRDLVNLGRYPNHAQAQDQEFARSVAREAADILKTTHTKRLIVCAGPKMLGDMRGMRDELQDPSLIIDEVARDLVQLSAFQLRDRLAEYGVLPPRLNGPVRG